MNPSRKQIVLPTVLCECLNLLSQYRQFNPCHAFPSRCATMTKKKSHEFNAPAMDVKKRKSRRWSIEALELTQRHPK